MNVIKMQRERWRKLQPYLWACPNILNIVQKDGLVYVNVQFLLNARGMKKVEEVKQI